MLLYVNKPEQLLQQLHAAANSSPFRYPCERGGGMIVNVHVTDT